MRKMSFQKCSTLALVMTGIFATAPVLADKPPWAGGGKENKHEGKDQNKRHDDKEWDWGGEAPHDLGGAPERKYFDDRQRAYVHDYYAEQFRAGHCPPGLAKKHNGCMPPGQAKKWTLGRPLPNDVNFYELPSTITMQIGVPPEGYRYVRVANDILLITTGTRMVVDAILDLGGMQ